MFIRSSPPVSSLNNGHTNCYTQPLFTKAGVYFLSLLLIMLLVGLQQASVYMVAKLLIYVKPSAPFSVINITQPSSDELNRSMSFSADEVIVWGGQNGTIVSLSLIITAVVMIGLIFALVFWRIKRHRRCHCFKSEETYLSHAIHITDNSNNAGTTNGPSITASYPNVQETTLGITEQIIQFLGLLPITWGLLVRLFGLFLVYALVSEIGLYVLQSDTTAFMDQLYNTAEPKWLLIVAVTIVVPIYEELMFRGIIWQAIRQHMNGKWGFWLTNLVTSILFVIIHVQYDLGTMSILLLFALLLGYARERSNSVLLPILLHGFNNALTMVLYVFAI